MFSMFKNIALFKQQIELQFTFVQKHFLNAMVPDARETRRAVSSICCC